MPHPNHVYSCTSHDLLAWASAGLPFLPPMPSNCPRAKTACTRRVNLLAHLVFLVFLVFSPTSTHHTNVLIAGLAQTEVMHDLLP